MTASIAHEINQPLATIVNNGKVGIRWLSRAEPDVKEALTSLKDVVDNSLRASEIVTNICAMFHRKNQEKRLLDANDLVRDVLTIARGEIDKQGASLHVELSDEIPRIMAERVPLQQVLLNLTVNALDAMTSIKDRGRLLSITSQIHVPNGVLITVADSGIGIDPKNMSRIFDAFFTTKQDGMGMGLSIRRSIVEAHGGQLWATPGTRHGSVFHVRLPAPSINAG
jgi:C4-dicarboxylate-specific signal transduction histidine kinase